MERRKSQIGISKRNISDKTQKSFAFFPRDDGARTKLFFKYIIRKYMMLIKNTKILSIEFYIFPLSSVFLWLLHKICFHVPRLQGRRLHKLTKIIWLSLEHLGRAMMLYILVLFYQNRVQIFSKITRIIIHDSSICFIYHSSDETRHQIPIIMEIYKHKINKY